MNAQRPELPAGLLSGFRHGLEQGNVLAALADGLVGKDTVIDGPFGPKPLVYADYVASGRALMQVERFVLEQVLPYYANSHTEASWCGGFMTRLRREARAAIAACCGANAEHAVIFTGSGATAGINRLATLFGVGPGTLVVIGPYEHHSNILPWRESGAEVIEVPEAAEGGPDLALLADALAEAGEDRRIVCAFSAASNVTGIVTDVAAVTRCAKAAGALMIWDYAGAGPYLPIAMAPEAGVEIDAVVVSPHKFIGGPGASGVLIVRCDAVVSERPTWPGGGTVRFVSPTAHDYSENLEAREEAGTPNVVGDIRAALAFLVKDVIGVETMRSRNREMTRRAIASWSGIERLKLLGLLDAERLPIFSFRVRDGKGGHVHQQLITRMLSDRFGIQARGGCACAGPYVHRLLGIGPAQSESMRQAILAGDEIAKPGFTRLNFSVLLSDAKVAFILDSVIKLAVEAPQHAGRYDFDGSRAIFFPRAA
ncbi:aminotransferase class V-fold PLP-dependent enzyme [Mesorhizobium sp. LHD-90]|uniref:aminotransferase class V-fold PLP-dependent enzyme n=1 Tax=Mesorhizobium sp. LHD-90 TaxID=3071414 RepID=UPI0027E0C343|nr:aminotransferase class V-fold PLP-dependent enzyme [Mesorhizobium sp. LHD-90]MDQ6435602.1 aminotransferase class V-fold PLP-dependent enzyme [Mesorhizobium sp. LHD-90]